MVSVLHLLWIVPLSAAIGAGTIAMLAVGKLADDNEQEGGDCYE